ncbi:MAG: hypothetical protein R3B09_09325 [Nannocystaceae bacterium]
MNTRAFTRPLGPRLTRAAAGGTSALALLAAPARAHAAPVCDGAIEAAALGVDAPSPPAAYALPTGIIMFSVSTTAELQHLLRWNSGWNHATLNILLEDGVYEPDDLVGGTYLRLWGGHHLWARHQGGAILKFGIDAGGNDKPNASGGPQLYGGGAELHGLVFDIDDPIHAPANLDGDPSRSDTYAIASWGSGAHVRVEDCTLHGNGVIDIGVRAWSNGIGAPEGFVGRRLEIDGFRVYGLAVNAPAALPDLAAPVVLADLTITDIGGPPIEWPSGEVGIWLGATGSLERARIRDVGDAGVLLGGNLRGGLVRDVDVDEIGDAPGDGVGIYLDNTTIDSDVGHFCVGPATRWGVISEWDNNTAPRGIRNEIHHGLIESDFIGVWFDQGTVDSHVHHCVLRNYTWAGIAFHHNLAALADWPNYAASSGSWGAGNVLPEPGVCAYVRDQHPNVTTNPICE